MLWFTGWDWIIWNEYSRKIDYGLHNKLPVSHCSSHQYFSKNRLKIRIEIKLFWAFSVFRSLTHCDRVINVGNAALQALLTLYTLFRRRYLVFMVELQLWHEQTLVKFMFLVKYLTQHFVTELMETFIG